MDVAEQNQNNANHLSAESDGQQQQQEPMRIDNETTEPLMLQVAAIRGEDLFDWMPLVDLHSLSRTCKYMQLMVGAFFRSNFAGAHVECKRGNIFIGDVRINGFCEEIESIDFCGDDQRSFEFAKAHEFKQLKQIKCRKITFTGEKIASILHILKKAEAVELYECSISGEFHKEFLQHCPEMKRLILEPIVAKSNSILGWDEYYETDLHSFIGTGNSWLLRQYPKIEYFGLHFGSCHFQVEELKLFFDKNPNVRKFATYAENLVYPFRNWIYDANLHLDDLAIKPYDFESGMYEGLDNVLPKNPFSKRLQIYHHAPVSIIERARHEYAPYGIDKCHFWSGVTFNEDFYPLMWTSSRELCIAELLPHDNMNEMASTLVNLEQIAIGKTTPKEIEALITHTPKLVTITVSSVEGNVKDIDLPKWNRQRGELVGACKVVVYVEESTYLQVKWATHDMHHSMVSMKRIETCKWEHDFDLW